MGKAMFLGSRTASCRESNSAPAEQTEGPQKNKLLASFLTPEPPLYFPLVCSGRGFFLPRRKTRERYIVGLAAEAPALVRPETTAEELLGETPPPEMSP